MALAKTFGVALTGVAGELVEIEADVSGGIPGLSFTGLADTSVVESRDRIRAAMGNSGVSWPNHKITLALLPADVRKVGSRFDLAMAVALLAAAGEGSAEPLANTVWLAELGLDGRLRPVRGVLPSILTAKRSGVDRVIVARGNAAEAALVQGVEVRAARDLGQVIAWLRGEGSVPPLADAEPDDGEGETAGDLADVAGQSAAKRGLEVSAAGNHHLYLVGAPGAGKTMLAERMPGLLPALDDEAALEVTAVHSVAGRLMKRARLVRRAPLQAPHHTASVAALVGGGSHLARPGAISLAHNGILFLDEAPEFSPRALEALRQPLESGLVVLHRGGGVVSYPARFLLVLAANPCPCGSRALECSCAPQARRRYQQRLSGPLLDRIDVRVQVDPVPHADLFGSAADRDPSAVVADRVAQARAAARERWRASPWTVNASVPGSALRVAPWALPHAVLEPAEGFLRRGEISARGFDRVLRLAWTVADLSGHVVPDAGDVAEAVFFRTGRSDSWAA
ncbi:MAG: YifB family Mg chelatase-like AAA ATPase [Jatrophihabitantaceae bacterium]